MKLLDFVKDFARLPTSMSNMTNSALCDELGLLNEMRKIVSKKENFIKEALRERMKQEDLDTTKGRKYEVTLKPVTTERISVPLVRKILTDEQLREVTQVSEASRMDVKKC